MRSALSCNDKPIYASQDYESAIVKVETAFRDNCIVHKIKSKQYAQRIII